MLLLVQHRNKAALRLYEKMGYRAMPRTKEHGSQVCMRKHLFMPSAHTLQSMAPKVNFVSSQ